MRLRAPIHLAMAAVFAIAGAAGAAERGAAAGKVVEKDRDGDGKPEVWIHQDEQGKPVRSEVDRNGDGAPDIIRWMEQGLAARDQADLNFDGKPDAWTFYQKGLKDLMIMDKNHDGKPDAWFYYGQAGLKLMGGSVDEDFDGKIDRSFGSVPQKETRKPW